MLFWALFLATLKIFAHSWDLILKINCMLQTHLKLDQSQTVLKLILFKILTCLMQATGTDRAAGYGMMLVSALIFVYYTIWVIFLVSCYPLCKFISLSDRLWLFKSVKLNISIPFVWLTELFWCHQDISRTERFYITWGKQLWSISQQLKILLDFCFDISVTMEGREDNGRDFKTNDSRILPYGTLSKAITLF